MFSISKNGFSTKELEGMFGVNYKTTWRMANKIRSITNSDAEVENGIVKMDESYVGGNEINKHKYKKSFNWF